MRRSVMTAAVGLALVAGTAAAQDMMRHVDLSSPDMVSAEMTRGDVEAAMRAATAAAPADFTGKRHGHPAEVNDESRNQNDETNPNDE